jgi:hypothetical protein
MIKFNNDSKKQIIDAYNKNGIFLEGNILKIIDPENDIEFKNYLENAIDNDKSIRKKRLEVTKQIQLQNKELVNAQEDNSKLMIELKDALQKAESAKKDAEEDLNLLQKKTQTELIGTIVKVALIIIIGIGVVTTLLFAAGFFLDKDTTLLGNAWSNMFGILLTNSFSIIGTIMGVKYATENNKDKNTY